MSMTRIPDDRTRLRRPRDTPQTRDTKTRWLRVRTLTQLLAPATRIATTQDRRRNVTRRMCEKAPAIIDTARLTGNKGVR